MVEHFTNFIKHSLRVIELFVQVGTKSFHSKVSSETDNKIIMDNIQHSNITSTTEPHTFPKELINTNQEIQENIVTTTTYPNLIPFYNNNNNNIEQNRTRQEEMLLINNRRIQQALALRRHNRAP